MIYFRFRRAMWIGMLVSLAVVANSALAMESEPTLEEQAQALSQRLFEVDSELAKISSEEEKLRGEWVQARRVQMAAQRETMAEDEDIQALQTTIQTLLHEVEQHQAELARLLEERSEARMEDVSGTQVESLQEQIMDVRRKRMTLVDERRAVEQRMATLERLMANQTRSGE